jgi:hypothetical protein
MLINRHLAICVECVVGCLPEDGLKEGEINAVSFLQVIFRHFSGWNLLKARLNSRNIAKSFGFSYKDVLGLLLSRAEMCRRVN